MATTQSTTPQSRLVLGTRLIIDHERQHGVKHAKDSEVILVPIPSSDPNDPLNWSWMRKHYNLALLCLWAHMVAAAVLGLSAAFGNVVEDLGITFDDVTLGQGLCILFLGLGNLIWVPLANYIGRRPVYLISTIILIFSQLFSAKIQTRGDFIGSRILTGFAGAPFEGLPATLASDVFFVHERGIKVACYFVASILGGCFGPMWTGHLAADPNLTWRWQGWVMIIILGVLFLVMLFTLDESKYDRVIQSEEVVVDDTSPTTTDKEAGPSSKDGKVSAIVDPNPVAPAVEKLTWTKRLTLYRLSDPAVNPTTFWQYALEPIAVMRFPAVLWAGFTAGIGVSMASVVNSTVSSIMESPPYGWTAERVGDSWTAQVVAALIAVPFAGWFSDYVALRWARKNKGVREVEFRLWAIIPSFVLLPGGLLIYGLCAYYEKPWIGVQFGNAVITLGYGILAEVVTSYIVEAYRPVALQCFAGFTAIRNVIAFALTWSTGPWSKLGYANLCGFSALIVFGILCLCGPLYIWGKRTRVWTSNKFPLAL